MLPITDVNLITEVQFQEFPTNTWFVDPVTKQIRGMIDDFEAMRQAIEIKLSIERFKFQIYTPNVGVEFAGLAGGDFGYIMSELKRRILDCFSPDIRVKSVTNFSFSKTLDGEMAASFAVNTVYGAVLNEVKIAI